MHAFSCPSTVDKAVEEVEDGIEARKLRHERRLMKWMGKLGCCCCCFLLGQYLTMCKVAAFIASFVGYAALSGVSDHKYCMVDSGYL